jgi:hypothetical protein
MVLLRIAEERGVAGFILQRIVYRRSPEGFQVGAWLKQNAVCKRITPAAKA